jgi:putative membrane protein
MKYVTLIAAVAMLACRAAFGADMPNTLAMGEDFATTAASSDHFEREAAKIAQERAQSAGVRDLAKMLETAHTQSTKELGMAAEQAGVSKPADKLNPGQKRMLEALEKADPQDFDKVYLQQQAQVHKDAQGLFETYAKVGKEAPLKSAATKLTPVIKEHLATVTRLQHAM